MQNELAINGGPAAVTKLESPSEPKVGAEEFLELAELWGFGAEAMDGIRGAIEGEDLGNGPHLTRYYNPNPSKVVAFEEQVATHGGLGGPQVRPFIVWPPECPLDPETLDDAQNLYPYFVQQYLEQPRMGEPDNIT